LFKPACLNLNRSNVVMNIYLIALYVHITGALAMFAGLGIEGIVFKNLKGVSSPQQALPWLGSMRILRIVFGYSAVSLLLTGVYMVILSWGWSSWIITGLVLLVGLSGYGSATGKKVAMSIASLINNKGQSIPSEVKSVIANPFLMLTYKLKITLALGIIFMMTTKPGWVGCIVTLAVAVALGYLLDLPFKMKADIKELESA
jgi:hypothetical protein